MKTTPSIDVLGKQSNEKASDLNVGQPEPCVMMNGRCNTHDCVIKKVVTRKKVWYWIEKRKEYGYKNTQKTRLLLW